MERAATDRAAVAGENPAGARVWEGGADGGADDCYHHCLREGDGTRRPAQERQAERAAGGRAAGRARARTAGYGKSAQTERTARAQARASRPRGRRRKRERQRGLACGRKCGARTHCGTHAGHTMRGACKRANGQVGGRERHRSSGHGTSDHTDTVKGMTWPPIVMPSASLVLTARGARSGPKRRTNMGGES
jgi:hypothetical protein